MTADVIQLSTALRDELAANELIDPRTVPLRHGCLKQIALSPAHYFAAVQDDDCDSLPLRLGAGTHALLYDKAVATFTGKVRNGKAWEAFEAEHTAAGAVILNVKEYDEASRLVEAILRHADARALLTTGTIEQTIVWERQGRICRGTPDAFTSERVVDLKTTRCGEPDRFRRDATFRGYHAQVAWYLDGLIAAGVACPERAYLVAVEKPAKPRKHSPYPVTVLELTPRAINMGRRLNTLWFEQLINSERANRYPAYSDSIVPFDVDEAFTLTGVTDDEGNELSVEF